MGGMSLVVFLSLFSVVLAVGNPGEPVMFFQPQPMNTPFDIRPIGAVHPQFQPISRSVPYEYQYRMIPQEQTVPQDRLQPILHTGNADAENQNLTNEFMEQRAAEEHKSTAKSGYDYPAHPQPYPSSPGYGYTAPASSYSPPPAAAAPSYTAPAHVPSKFPILKPDISTLIKPVTTKVATKVSGLIGLVLSLLTGTAPDDLEMKGFKDIVINGIVKPLLIAKGGIKSLISKLTIPVISLLLINLEVLITVWWLWEECPDPVKHVYTKPSYPANYNSY